MKSSKKYEEHRRNVKQNDPPKKSEFLYLFNSLIVSGRYPENPAI